MEENNSTRSSRHSQKPSNNLGKNIFTLLSILLVVLFGFFAYTFYQMKQAEAKAQKVFEEKTTALLQEVQEERNQSGIPSEKTEKKATDLVTVTYQPKEDKVFSAADSNKELTALTNKAKESLKDKKGLIVAKLEVNPVSDQLDTYELVAEPYVWHKDKQSFTKGKPVSNKPAYIAHKTGKAVTVKELIPEEGDLLGIQQVIQQKIFNEAKDKKAVIDSILDLPRINYQNKIEFTPDELTIDLAKNKTGVDQVTLDYKDIAAYVNTDFVNPEKIKDAFPQLDPKKKYVALTFDDGPNPATTPKILDILKNKKASATFFMLGKNVSDNQDIVKRVVADGHEVASHSYTHPVLPSLSDAALKKEIRDTDKAIFEACGILPRNLRPPYGAADERVARVAGKPIINWDVDSEDWKSKNAGMIQGRIKATLTENAIVLMHDIQPATVEALPGVIDNMRQQGFEFVSVDTLLKKQQKPMYVYFGAEDYRLAKDL